MRPKGKASHVTLGRDAWLWEFRKEGRRKEGKEKGDGGRKKRKGKKEEDEKEPIHQE